MFFSRPTMARLPKLICSLRIPIRCGLVLQRYVLKVVVTGLAAQFGRLERKTSAAQQLGHAFLPTCFLALFAVAFVLVVGLVPYRS